MDELKVDDIVVIRASEDWPEHLFRITEVFDDCVGGYSLNGHWKASTASRTST